MEKFFVLGSNRFAKKKLSLSKWLMRFSSCRFWPITSGLKIIKRYLRILPDEYWSFFILLVGIAASQTAKISSAVVENQQSYVNHFKPKRTGFPKFTFDVTMWIFAYCDYKVSSFPRLLVQFIWFGEMLGWIPRLIWLKTGKATADKMTAKLN